MILLTLLTIKLTLRKHQGRKQIFYKAELHCVVLQLRSTEQNYTVLYYNYVRQSRITLCCTTITFDGEELHCVVLQLRSTEQNYTVLYYDNVLWSRMYTVLYYNNVRQSRMYTVLY